jgi:hypothetical protein
VLRFLVGPILLYGRSRSTRPKSSRARQARRHMIMHRHLCRMQTRTLQMKIRSRKLREMNSKLQWC